MDPRRRLLLSMLSAALEAVGGRSGVRRALADVPLESRRYAAIAIGKAAAAMLQGARDALGTRLGPAIVVTRSAPPDSLAPSARRSTEWLEASHPLPDARSIAAGRRVFAWIEALPPGQPVILLISGGASSLIELPRAGVTLEQIRALNERALSSGIDIATLNLERTRLSAIKGGGLTRALHAHPALALFISDVPGDDPAVIGSGLAGPLAAPPGSDGVRRSIVANVELAMRAVAERARELGLGVAMADTRFAGEAAEVGVQSARRLRDCGAEVWIAGGESVVRLPRDPGRGGRNQHLALAAALEIEGDPERLVMGFGTDGIDGPTEDAGGLVDGGSCRRIELAGLNAAALLAAADAGRALEAAGDLVTTGETGTNVGDLVVGLRLAETQAAELLAAHGEAAVPML